MNGPPLVFVDTAFYIAMMNRKDFASRRDGVASISHLEELPLHHNGSRLLGMAELLCRPVNAKRVFWRLPRV